MKIRIDMEKVLPFALPLYINWVRSLRVQFLGANVDEVLVNEAGKPILLAAWHSELFSLASLRLLRPNIQFSTIISQSKDGEMIARAIERCGATVVRGSSSRGGVRALLGLKRRVEKHNDIGVITLDGPRGPRYEIKDGIIFLAHKMNAEIVPIRIYPGKKTTCNSWDKFEVPFPFTKTKIYLGQPILLPEGVCDEAYMEEQKVELKSRLMKLGPI